MRLIVGLGNPGNEYEKTRHNAGFRAVRMLHTLHVMDFGGWQKKFEGELSEGRIGDEKVGLLLPQTFMNDSGRSVGAAAQFWKIDPKDVIVVYDELDLPLGTIRVRPEGSANGHNGVKSIIAALGTNAFPRVRIGIGTERAKTVPAEDFVLEKFNAEEETTLGASLKKAVEAVEIILAESVDAAMNRMNG